MTHSELEISDLSDEGWGIASQLLTNGQEKRIVVPYCCLGEKVEANLYRYKHKSGARSIGFPTKIVQPSPLRIPARCKHFTQCGGCSFQHIPYEEQLKLKEHKIRKLFEGISVLPIIAAPTPWQYRNKMEFTFSESKVGDKYLGLILAASKGRVFNLEECYLVNPWMATTLEACREWWKESTLQAYHCHSNRGSLRTLTLREGISTQDRVVMLTVSGNPDYALKKQHLETFEEAMKKIATAPEGAFLTIVLRVQQIVKGRQTQFYEMILHGPDHFRERVQLEDRSLEFHISPSSFFQPNSRQAGFLYSKALSMAALTKSQVLYDLYAGIGVFGMCAAHLVKQVVSVEISPDSAYDATCNVKRLQLDNVELFKADVAELLTKQEMPAADVIIVDPPRSGLGKKVVQQIVTLSPKRLVYVSCNPVTQAEDVKELQAQGYLVEAIQPVDQFPQTPHVENIVLLFK